MQYKQMSTWNFVAAAAFICMGSVAMPAFGELVEVSVVLPIDKIAPYQCGGGAMPVGAQCFGARLDIPVATDVDLSTDTLRVIIKFPNSLRLRWDDGLTSFEAVSVVADNSAEPIGVNGGTLGMRLTFTDPAGDLLASDIDWNFVGSTGGLLIYTPLSGISNLTDSSFSFSGVVAQMGPFSCSYPVPAPCDRPPVTIDTVSVYFGSGFFSIFQGSAPVADAGPDQTVTQGSLVQLDGSGSTDPDGGPESLRFTWEQLGGPAATLSDPSAAEPSFVGAVAGLYTFALVVNDGQSESVPDTITVTVRSRVSTLCSILGKTHSWLDQDVFRFDGTKGQRVTVKLFKDAGPSEGKRATLLLVDAIRGVTLVRADAGVLPNVITATLPKTGRYYVIVAEQPKFAPGNRFIGSYCVSLESSGNAQDTFAAHARVE
jgi:hypothetical protein